MRGWEIEKDGQRTARADVLQRVYIYIPPLVVVYIYIYTLYEQGKRETASREI